MTCHYCSAENEPDVHRCSRCGRRLNCGSPEIYPFKSAAAPALHHLQAGETESSRDSQSGPGPQLVTELPRVAEARGHMFQASLFGPQEVALANIEERPVRRPSSPPRTRREAPDQQPLEFPPPPTLHGSTEAALRGDAPVAVVTHRAMAAILDTSLAVLAVALFAATLHFAGEQIAFTKATIPVYTLAAALITVFYRLLFCIAEADTPGMRWTGLQLLNFDGHTPTRRQRLVRLGGGLVSFISAGLGLLWALVDEERLTWHDHISQTFPTPTYFVNAHRS